MNEHNQHLTDEQELQAIASLLTTTDLSHRSQIRQSLRHRLIEQSNQKGQITMLNRIWKPATAIAVIVLVATLALPSVRAFAQSLLVEVGMFTITDEKHDTEPMGFDPTAPTATPIDPVIFNQARVEEFDGGTIHSNISSAEAQTIAGFDPLRAPSYVPTGYIFQTRTAIVGDDQASVDVIYYRVDNDDPLNVSQIRGEENSTTFGVGPQASVVEVEVNGGPATFIGDAFVDYSDSQNPDRERLASMLLWEEGDYTFKIMSFELDQNELLAIANSMYN